MNARYNRRRAIQLAALMSSSAALSAIAQGCNADRWLDRMARPDGDRLRIGYLPITDASALLAAYHKGFFTAEGLEVDPPRKYRSWSAIATALQRGEVNVVHLLMPAAIWLRYGEGFAAKVVAWNHTNGSALSVLPAINRVIDLAGRTVAIPFWFSIHNLVLQMLLRDQGLMPIAVTAADQAIPENAVGLRVMPPPDMLAALKEESIAGFIVAEPYNSAAELSGTGKILRMTGDVWRDHACCVAVVPEPYTLERPDWTQRVVTGLVKAQQWCKVNRPELTHLLSGDGGQYMDYPPNVLKRTIDQYDMLLYRESGAIVHPEWRSRRIDFQPYPFPSYTQALVAELQTAFLGETASPAFVDRLVPQRVADELVDASFALDALRYVGGPQAFGLSPDLQRREVIHV